MWGVATVGWVGWAEYYGLTPTHWMPLPKKPNLEVTK